MIPSAMNRDELRKYIDKTLRFVPPPKRDSATGSWESDMNLWILRGETADKKGFEFLNTIRDHNLFILDHNQIRNFDAPDKLVLRGQVIFKDISVLFEPFHPRPASLLASSTTLHLYLDGTDESGVCVISSPMFDALRFHVKNIGEQTVRDYRNIILVPQAFSRPTSPSYIRDLAEQGETMLEEQQYTVYGNFIPKPIFRKQSEKIGELILKADPGDYILRWQIHCDDGVFPTETTYGELKVRVSSFGDLVGRAVENLYKA